MINYYLVWELPVIEKKASECVVAIFRIWYFVIFLYHVYQSWGPYLDVFDERVWWYQYLYWHAALAVTPSGPHHSPRAQDIHGAILSTGGIKSQETEPRQFFDSSNDLLVTTRTMYNNYIDHDCILGCWNFLKQSWPWQAVMNIVCCWWLTSQVFCDSVGPIFNQGPKPLRTPSMMKGCCSCGRTKRCVWYLFVSTGRSFWCYPSFTHLDCMFFVIFTMSCLMMVWLQSRAQAGELQRFLRKVKSLIFLYENPPWVLTAKAFLHILRDQRRTCSSVAYHLHGSSSVHACMFYQ